MAEVYQQTSAIVMLRNSTEIVAIVIASGPWPFVSFAIIMLRMIASKLATQTPLGRMALAVAAGEAAL